jgi:hypothetical protein
MLCHLITLIARIMTISAPALTTILGEEFDVDELRDIVEHGMSSGVSGFIYYHETTDKFDEYDDEIQDYLSDWCHDNGMGQASFAYFAPDTEDITQLKNKLVWSYVELKAHEALCEMNYDLV